MDAGPDPGESVRHVDDPAVVLRPCVGDRGQHSVRGDDESAGHRDGQGHLAGADRRTLLHHPDLLPVWWSLALGACLGGNATAIGASANVIVVGMSEKAGKKISFMKFMLYGMPMMIMTVVISTVYV